MEATEGLHDHLANLLRRFAGAAMANDETVKHVVSFTRWFSLPGGNVLFEEGEPSDALYIVVDGVLAASVAKAGGGERIVGRLGPGEIVGEMGCVTGEPRSATVQALRTCELLEVNWKDLEEVAASDPFLLTAICRTVVQRLARAQEGRLPSFQPRTFTILSASDGIDTRLFGEQFKDALSVSGSVGLITRQECMNKSTDELRRLETSLDYTVYVAESEDLAWVRLCLRQADAIIVAIPGGDPPFHLPDSISEINANIPRILAVMWDDDIQLGSTAAWIRSVAASRHFHIRGRPDIRRMARLLTGKGLGFVLSGGGARGLAHIGVAQALSEHGIEVDAVMGTSIGALVGAGVALEWEHEKLVEKIRRFSRVSPIFDLTIPRQSLLAGRNLRSSLEDWFGDLEIEDSPIPYSCLSTCLNTGDVSIHDRGSFRYWTAASAAIPGLFPPVVVNESVHVDGGVLNNMPSDLIRNVGAGFVVAVDVSGGAQPAEIQLQKAINTLPPIDRMNILELLTKVTCVGDSANAAIRRKQCDVLIVPDVGSIGLLSFRSYPQAIRAGYHAAIAYIENVEKRQSHEVLALPSRAQL